MREIKFRGIQAFGTSAGRWLYGSLSLSNDEYAIDEGYSAQIITATEGAIYVKRETVGQYTGLNDKGGLNIYEDDIIKVYDWGHQTPERVLGVTSVDWDLDDSGWRYHDFSITEDFYDQFRSVEVIGDIHTTPELLEVTE